ncbi:hypothetical protein QN277_010236 [Acacia crassicarpa]|uniref:Uncharacterized protein n=1 Tax=Acacia crassicarpa TaxID=499986 RepID=A0AAE1M538_9FABA|nr:hypothetical protein QN277_010236 [Acacia crassicarpa]
MFGWALQFVFTAFVIAHGLHLLVKKIIKAEGRREETRRLVRLAKSEPATVESERQRITDVACSVCYHAPTTTRCSRCKVTRYCSGKCQIIHWRQGHRDDCVETKGNHCRQAETNYEEDEPRTDKQPSVPDAITNNSSNSFSFTLGDFLGRFRWRSHTHTHISDDDAEEENTNPNPLIERSEDATKQALEQSEERVRLLEEELAKSRKEISLLKSECNNWSARTSFVSRRLASLSIESDENQSGWVKALRELEEERELVRLLKMECEEIRQSSMRQVEKKEQELAIALNATAAAKAKLFDLEREVNSLADKACAICLTNEKDIAFGCGHMACEDCMLTISNCHICREPITSRLKLFLG